MATPRDKYALMSFLRMRHDDVARGKPKLGSITPDGALVYVEFSLTPAPSAHWCEQLAAAARGTVMEGRCTCKANKLTLETTEEELDSDVQRLDALLKEANGRYAAQIAQAKAELDVLRQTESTDQDAKARLQERLRKLR